MRGRHEGCESRQVLVLYRQKGRVKRLVWRVSSGVKEGKRRKGRGRVDRN